MLHRFSTTPSKEDLFNITRDIEKNEIKTVIRSPSTKRLIDAKTRRQRMKKLFARNPARSRKVVRRQKALGSRSSALIARSQAESSNVVVVKKPVTTTTTTTTAPPTTTSTTTTTTTAEEASPRIISTTVRPTVKRNIFVTSESPSSAPPTGKHFDFEMYYTMSTLMPPHANSEISLFDYPVGMLLPVPQVDPGQAESSIFRTLTGKGL